MEDDWDARARAAVCCFFALASLFCSRGFFDDDANDEAVVETGEGAREMESVGRTTLFPRDAFEAGTEITLTLSPPGSTDRRQSVMLAVLNIKNS